MGKSRRAPEHYVNNRDFSTAMVEYVTDCEIAKENNQEEPDIPDYIADCIMRIAEGLSHKSNFVRYTYREDMVMDAVLNCLSKLRNFDAKRKTRTGLPNAFAYFTQISMMAFIRRINKENRQRDIKENLVTNNPELLADFSQMEHGDQMVSKVQHYRENFNE